MNTGSKAQVTRGCSEKYGTSNKHPCCLNINIYSGLGVIRVNGKNTKLKHKWQPEMSASRAKCKHQPATFSSERILAVAMKKVLETPKEGRTNVSVGKDDVKEENRHWQQDCHLTKNSIRHKTVDLNFNTLLLCITS